MSKPLKEVVREECLNMLNEYVQPLYQDSVEPDSSECCRKVLSTVTVINGEVAKIEQQLDRIRRDMQSNNQEDNKGEPSDEGQPNLEDLEDELRRIWDGLDELQKKSPSTPKTMLDRVLDSLGDQAESLNKWIPTIVRTISDFLTRQKLQDLQYTMSILNKQMKDLAKALPGENQLTKGDLDEAKGEINDAIGDAHSDLFNAIQTCCINLNSKINQLMDDVDTINSGISGLPKLSDEMKKVSNDTSKALDALGDLNSKADNTAQSLKGIKEVADAIYADTDAMTTQGGTLEQITNELRQIKLSLP